MSHYFSLVRISRAGMHRRELRDELRRLAKLGEAYRDHCLMMKLFPGLQARWDSVEQNERERDFVFRLRTASATDPETALHTLSYYVVSQERPRELPDLLRVDCKEYAPKLQAGDRVRFQLRANPSVTQSRGGDASRGGHASMEQSRHKPQRDALALAMFAAREGEERQRALTEAASAWLLQRAGAWGVRVDPGALLTDNYTHHRLHRGSRHITFASIDYTGVAEVADPVLLTKAMLEGVGRKRGFGCGLLLVRRLED